MSFGVNIQYLRKREDMTQEEFAEKMNVSRQTVSKWESDASFPETDKILQICDLFSCNLDDLMRGNIEESSVSDKEEYDKEHNRCTFSVAGGCGIILAGVTLMLVLLGTGVSETISTMTFLVFVVVSVAMFIISGIQYGDYIKQHPQIQPFYKKEDVDRFNHQYPLLIAIPTALILIGVIWTVGSGEIHVPSGMSKDQWDALLAAPLLLLITVSVPIYVYAGMQKSKYDIEEYNRKHSQDEETLKRNKKTGAWCGVIMLTAVAAFLLMGFLGDLWKTAWVVFPIGGILCGIV